MIPMAAPHVMPSGRVGQCSTIRYGLLIVDVGRRASCSSAVGGGSLAGCAVARAPSTRPPAAAMAQSTRPCAAAGAREPPRARRKRFPPITSFTSGRRSTNRQAQQARRVALEHHVELGFREAVLAQYRSRFGETLDVRDDGSVMAFLATTLA